MEKAQVNRKAARLFGKWKKQFRDSGAEPTDEYYKRLEAFKKECYELHSVLGVYEVLTNLNALKMASICGSLRFIEPYRMLYALQKTTKTY